MRHITLKIKNRISELENLMPPISEFLHENEVGSKASYVVNLALEEMFTNIVKYAYRGSDERDIDVSLGVNESTIQIRLEDDGEEFDPCEFPSPDTTLPVENRTAGGLGIHLVRKMAEAMEYSRVNGKNILNITVLK